jgi:hypothetical protein
VTWFLDLCAAIGFISIACIASAVLLVGWATCVNPPLQVLRLRVRAWRETRRAIARVLDESRSYLTSARPCGHYHGTGTIAIRNGVMSDFCRRCGQPYGAHQRVSA